MKNRKLVQQVLMGGLCCIFIFSQYRPLFITAYIVLCFHVLSSFSYINHKENENENKGHLLAQIIFALTLQLFLIGIVFALSWYLVEKKLGVILITGR